MAIADIRKLIGVGVPPEMAKVVDEIVTSSGASIAWADVTGTQAGVEAAVAAKTSIAALTSLTGAFGTTGDAIADVTNAFSQTILNDNFRRLEDKVNAVIAALK